MTRSIEGLLVVDSESMNQQLRRIISYILLQRVSTSVEIPISFQSMLKAVAPTMTQSTLK